MRSVQVDAQRRLAHVQGGALWGDVDRETQAFGLAAPGGVVSDTGVAGLTLGGGYGWLRRKYGLSIDSLVEAQVVCADGQIARRPRTPTPTCSGRSAAAAATSASSLRSPSSFTRWGPRWRFGDVLPLEEYADILRGWRPYVEEAPNEVTSVCVSLTFPADPEMPEAVHDRPCAIVGGVYAGDVEEGMEATKPLRELGTPLFDMSGPTPYVGSRPGSIRCSRATR